MRSASFPVKTVLAATRAKLPQLDTSGIIALILLGGVIPFPALDAFERDHRADTSFSRHTITFDPILGYVTPGWVL